MVKAEDYLHSNTISMVDEAILKVREEVEKGTLTDASSDRFYFLSYLLSRPDLSLQDVTIICLSIFLDGLSTTTPTALFALYRYKTHASSQVYRILHHQPGIVLFAALLLTLECRRNFTKKSGPLSAQHRLILTALQNCST